MRYLLLIILLWLPDILAAQSWNISANGGIVLNTITSRPVAGEHMAGLGGIASLQVGYTRNHWEAGLSTAFRRYAVRVERDLIFEDDFDPLTGTIKSVHHMRWLETFPAIAIMPFVNRHFRKGKADWYAGLSAGYAIMLQKQIGALPQREYIRSRAFTDGITAGIHAGCAYPVWRKWSLCGEAGIHGLWLKAFSLQNAMVTAGVQFRFK